MGEVKQAVKGQYSKPTCTDVPSGNILERTRGLRNEVSVLIVKKDDDALNEGVDAAPENMRKAANLRAVASLLNTAITLLEDY